MWKNLDRQLVGNDMGRVSGGSDVCAKYSSSLEER